MGDKRRGMDGGRAREGPAQPLDPTARATGVKMWRWIYVPHAEVLA